MGQTYLPIWRLTSLKTRGSELNTEGIRRENGKDTEKIRHS